MYTTILTFNLFQKVRFVKEAKKKIEEVVKGCMTGS
jgi:hypothetical protein